MVCVPGDFGSNGESSSGSCPVSIQSIQIPQGGSKEFELTVYQPGTNVPFDLTYGESNPTVAAKLASSEHWGSSGRLIFKVDGTVIDAASGVIRFSLSSSETAKAGIFTATLVVYVNDAIVLQQPYYVEITPSDLFANNGPPTIAEIRLWLRDLCPSANTLLDDYEWSDFEIAAAIRRPLDWFNAEPPPLNMDANVTNFMFRYPWMNFTIGELLRMAGHRLRRNRLRYTAGGTELDPEARAVEYEQIGSQMIEEAKAQLRDVKITLNISGGFASLGSAYARWGYRVTH